MIILSNSFCYTGNYKIKEVVLKFSFHGHRDKKNLATILVKNV